jgi:hypothetical protein
VKIGHICATKWHHCQSQKGVKMFKYNVTMFLGPVCNGFVDS